MSEPKSESKREKTIRSSKQRQIILDIIAKQTAHLSAEDIYRFAKAEQPQISLGTVYRNLEVLTEMGTISRANFADGKARYELATAGHHHHLVCLKCGDIADIAGCPVVKEIDDMMHDHDFQPLHHYFEIYGYCAKCK